MQQRSCSRRGSSMSSWLVRLRTAGELIFNGTPWRVSAVNAVLAPVPYHLISPLRSRLYRWAGLRGIDRTVFIEGPIYLRARPHAYKKLRIGARTEVFGPCWIEAGGDVTIGADVGICIGVSIFSSMHEIGTADRRMGRLVAGFVRIEDGAWIGAKSIITAGVTVGRGSIVGPGSLVLKDVPANTLVQGSPARVVRWLENPDGSSAAGVTTIGRGAKIGQLSAAASS